MANRNKIKVNFWNCPSGYHYFFFSDDSRLVFDGVVDYYRRECGNVYKIRHPKIDGTRSATSQEHRMMAGTTLRNLNIVRVTFYRNGIELITADKECAMEVLIAFKMCMYGLFGKYCFEFVSKK